MKIELFLHPGYVSGIGKNHCSVCARITVRNQQEPVSGLSRNCCPVWSRISVRFDQEYAQRSGGCKNSEHDLIGYWICTLLCFRAFILRLIEQIDPEHWRPIKDLRSLYPLRFQFAKYKGAFYQLPQPALPDSFSILFFDF